MKRALYMTLIMVLCSHGIELKFGIACFARPKHVLQVIKLLIGGKIDCLNVSGFP